MENFWLAMVIISMLSLVIHEPWFAVVQLVSFFLAAGVAAYQAYETLPLQKRDVPKFLFFVSGSALFTMNVLFFAIPSIKETVFPSAVFAFVGVAMSLLTVQLILEKIASRRRA